MQFNGSQYLYNCEGQRIQKITPQENTTYVLENNKMLSMKKTSNGILNRLDFIYDAYDRLIGFELEGITYYYKKDITGIIRQLVDENNQIVVKYDYDAFGKVTKQILVNIPGAQHNPFVYKDYYLDDESGYYYCDSRYYDPEVVRFIQPADALSLKPDTMNGLNVYTYAFNNPISIAYGSSSVGFGNSGFGGNFTKDWINLKPVPSLVETAVDVADVGFSASIVGLTAWYTLKYPGVADLMKLDGIASIPGKYADFVEGLGYAFVFVETGIDVYNNWQKGQSAGYIFASGAYTFGTGMAITWGSAKLGAYIGTSIGGPVGFIVGGVAGILIGLGLEWLSDEIKEWIF